jgi:hypothetical protein
MTRVGHVEFLDSDPQPLSISAAGAICNASLAAYCFVANKKNVRPDAVYCMDEAHDVTMVMSRFLFQYGGIGIDSMLAPAVQDVKAGPEVIIPGLIKVDNTKTKAPVVPKNWYSYVVFPSLGSEEVIADAVYQSRLPKDKQGPDKPKVLVGTREAVIDRIKQLGQTDESVLSAWLPRVERDSSWINGQGMPLDQVYRYVRLS